MDETPVRTPAEPSNRFQKSKQVIMLWVDFLTQPELIAPSRAELRAAAGFRITKRHMSWVRTHPPLKWLFDEGFWKDLTKSALAIPLGVTVTYVLGVSTEVIKSDTIGLSLKLSS
jgi:hypothetical protein